MTKFATASLGVITLYCATLILFTFLQLKYNKTKFAVDGVNVCSVSDIIEFLVPVSMVPLYWLIWFRGETGKITFSRILPMLFATLIFTHGHGVHLAANSLSNSLHCKENGLKMVSEDSIQLQHYIIALDYFDEFLSHWLWIGGVVVFAATIIYGQVKGLKLHGKVVEYLPAAWITRIICVVYGLGYGVVFWAHNIEGNTVLIGLPFCVFVIFWILANRKLLSISPISVMFFVSHICTLALFVFWYIQWGGFPEFSQLPKGADNPIGSFYATQNQKPIIKEL